MLSPVLFVNQSRTLDLSRLKLVPLKIEFRWRGCWKLLIGREGIWLAVRRRGQIIFGLLRRGLGGGMMLILMCRNGGLRVKMNLMLRKESNGGRIPTVQ